MDTRETIETREGFVAAVRARLAGEPGPRLADAVQDLRADDVAELMRELGDAEVFDAWELLHAEVPDLAVEVLPLLDAHDVSRVVDELPDDRVAEVLDELPANDATYVLEQLDEDRVEDVVAAMDVAEAAAIERRLRYPEDSAGRFMSDRFLALPPDATAGDAARRIQEASDEVSVAYVYLVEDARLVGVVSIRRLLQVKPDRRLSTLSPETVTAVGVTDDQEHVARVMRQHDYVALPVVDERSVLVGVVTHDDVMDVMSEEATEDMLAMAGTSADDVISEAVFTSARLRMPWLLVAFLIEMVAVVVLRRSESRLGDTFIALALFMPAISAMTGNVGVQASTIVVRGLATGSIRRHDSLSVFWRELRTAFVMAAAYGVVLAVVASLVLDQGAAFAVVVGCGLLVSMSLASVFGTVVPILFQASGIDPAIATGPFVTTSMDVLAFLTYFTLASWLLLG